MKKNLGENKTMKIVLRILAVLALALTVVPSILVFKQVIAWQIHAHLMLAGTVLWFLTAPGAFKKA
jgi:hypothetical protein